MPQKITCKLYVIEVINKKTYPANAYEYIYKVIMRVGKVSCFSEVYITVVVYSIANNRGLFESIKADLDVLRS